MSENYYQETAHPGLTRPRLEGDHRFDLCVVGGGCTGLAAALAAARLGYSVALLEADHIGFGASGRNGGQIIPGLRLGPVELAARFGPALGERLFRWSIAARDHVRDLIGEHRIDCDLRLTGHLQVSRNTKDRAHFQEEAALAARFGHESLDVLDRGDLAEELASDHYHCGLLDRKGGHFHPLNYTLGLAAACETMGIKIFEQSRLRSLSEGTKIIAGTETGSITADHAILACDALLGRLNGAMADRMMPILSHIVTTPKLPPEMDLIPHDRAVSDSYFAVNYFRLTADRRLLFGGGERYFPGETKDIHALVRKPLERIFPQLRGFPLIHGWSGAVSITRSRLPDIGRFGKIFYAQGYSGQGAILSSLVGEMLATSLEGGNADFAMLQSVAPRVFPGGRHLRTPLHLIGMIWYALQDRLGIAL